MRPWVSVLAAAALVLAGCAQTTDGTVEWDPAQASAPLEADDLNVVLLNPSQVSQIVDARMQNWADQRRPVPGKSSAPECTALDSAGMQAFVGDSWTAFRLLLFADGIIRDHVVAESAALYPDPPAAAMVFTAATEGLADCDGKQAAGIGRAISWTFSVNAITSDAVLWNKEQTNLDRPWVCWAQARLRGNAILQAMVCQSDDGGQAIAAAMLDQMSARAWERSAPRR
jgi:hypothetical protein